MFSVVRGTNGPGSHLGQVVRSARDQVGGAERYFMSRSTRLAVAVALVVGALGAAGPAGAQDEGPFIVSWIGGGFLLGAPVDSFVAGQDYADGEEVELILNGVSQGTTLAEGNAEGTATPSFEVAVVPGDEVKLVRLDYGNDTQVMIIADMGVTLANATTDVVTGFGTPGAAITVVVLPQDEFGDETVFRFVTADANGQFIADFSVPGPTPEEQATIDLLEGGLGATLQEHDNHHVTALFWAGQSGTSEPISRSDCKLDGWEAMTDVYGISFKNQGDCVSYVATGGGNSGSG